MSVSQLYYPNKYDIRSKKLILDSPATTASTLELTKKVGDIINHTYTLPANTKSAAVGSVLGLVDVAAGETEWIGVGASEIVILIGAFESGYTGMNPSNINAGNIAAQGMVPFDKEGGYGDMGPNEDLPTYIPDTLYDTISESTAVTVTTSGRYIVEVRAIFETGADNSTHCFQVRSSNANTEAYQNMRKYLFTTDSANSHIAPLFIWDNITLEAETELNIYYRLVGGQASTYFTSASLKLIYIEPIA